MGWANPALWTAIAGAVTAIGGAVAVFRHVTGPAHKPPDPPPPSGTGSP